MDHWFSCFVHVGLSFDLLFTVGTLTFCDRREQNTSALIVERSVLGFPKHNLAPSSKNKRRDISFKPGKLPELHLRLECDETGKFRVYEKSVLLDEKEYDRQRVENLADTMGLQIEGNKITLNSSEKEIEDDIFRLIAGCYLIYYLHYFMGLP